MLCLGDPADLQASLAQSLCRR